MKDQNYLKIDIFTHIFPQSYVEAIKKIESMGVRIEGALRVVPTLLDLDLRFRIMDRHEGMMQVLTLGMPFVKGITDSEKNVELSKIANDGLAELVFKYPDRFAAAVASIPMNNMDAALRETERAIDELKFRGVQIFTPSNDKPLDSPEFLPLYEKMADYNLPIWIHPCREIDYADYRTEDTSKYRLASLFGWPYETSAAMIRLTFSGILEKFPNLKFITHHCGAMIPYLSERIAQFYDTDERRGPAEYRRGLNKAPLEYLKMFYNDTAIYGNTSGLMCAYAFFGADKLLFGTDTPFDNQLGARVVRQTINAIEEMEISQSEKKQIFQDNARSLLRLPT